MGDTMRHSDAYYDALEMVRRFGYEQAVKDIKRHRDMNSLGTASYANHHAVYRELLTMATVGRVG